MGSETLMYSKDKINQMIQDSSLQKVSMMGVYQDLQKLKLIIEELYDKHIFYLSYWESDAPYFGWDASNDKYKNMAAITDGITERFKEIYALILAGLGEEIKSNE